MEKKILAHRIFSRNLFCSIFESFMNNPSCLQTRERHNQSKQKPGRIMSIQNTMNFKTSVVLLFIFATTLPFGQQSMESFSVMATNINENQTQANIDVTSTQPMLSETCTDRFCYNLTSEHMNAEIDLRSTAIKGYDHYRSYSILYSILEMASDRYEGNQCHRELIQMYNGIHRKEIWAMKGNFKCIFVKLADEYD